MKLPQRLPCFKRGPLLLVWVFLTAGTLLAQNQAPVPVLGTVSVDTANRQVTIDYDVSDLENDSLEMSLRISADGGTSFRVPTATLSGDIGWPVIPGTNKSVVWTYDPQVVGAFTGSGPVNFIVKLIADDRVALDIQTLVDQVDSARIRANLTFIQGIRHRTANPTHLGAVKDTIEARFAQAGLQTDRQPWTFVGYTAENMIGRIPGTTDETATLFNSGHFDTVINTPGADDNGSSIAAMLEVMRVLAPYHYEKSIRFLAFDLEEAGLLGSAQYVLSGLEDWEQVDGLINFEMIGYRTDQVNTQSLPTGFNLLFPDVTDSVAADSNRGNFILNVANTTSHDLKLAFDAAAATYVPDLRELSLEAPGNAQIAPDLRRSDHASFWDAGYPALMITDGADTRYPWYHHPNDTLENLDFRFMKQVTQTATATLAELAGIQHSGVVTGGNFTLDLPVSIPSPEVVNDLQVYPNPFSSQLTVTFELPTPSEYVATIRDLNGKEVWQFTHPQPTTGKQVMDWQSGEIAPGVFFLEIRTDNGNHIEKIVKYSE